MEKIENYRMHVEKRSLIPNITSNVNGNEENGGKLSHPALANTQQLECVRVIERECALTYISLMKIGLILDC